MKITHVARPAVAAGRKALTSLVAALSGFLGACALATPPIAVPPQEALPGLESAVTQDPTYLEAALELTLGYVASNRLQDARRLLEDTHAAVPTDRTALALLGLVEHALGLHVDADEHFTLFLTAHPRDPLASEVRLRRDAVRPMALLNRARTRLAQAPTPGEDSGSSLVAVLPFRVRAGGAEGAYLATAFAELTSVGLEAAGLALVDSGEIRALLEAMTAPSDEPFTLGGTAGVGALLDAGSVVYGLMDLSVADSLTVEAAILNRDEEGLSFTAFEVRGRMEHAASLQKRVAVLVHRVLRGDVDIEEATLLNLDDWPETRALTAFGEGLLLDARGDLVGAAEALGRALADNAELGPAAELAERIRLAIEVSEAPLLPTALATVRIGELQRSLAGLQSRPGSAAQATGRRIGARNRTLAAELLGLDRLGWGASYEIVLTLPPAVP